jgi:hypothetical protein
MFPDDWTNGLGATVAIALLTMLTPLACNDDGGGGGGGDPDGSTDSDTDSDTDTDADTDTDTDTGEFELDHQRVFDDVAWLCAEEREGRKPGTQGNDDAVDYVEDLFEEIGLAPVGEDAYRQQFAFNMWDVTGPSSAILDGTDLTHGTDFIIFTLAGGGNVTGDVVFAGHGMTIPPFDPVDYPSCPIDSAGYDDFEAIDATGKIALVIRHGPDDDEGIHENCPANEACNTTPCLWNFGYKANNAALHGAVGMLLVNHYQTTGDFQNGVTIGPEYFDEDFPSIFVNRSLVEAAVPDLESWSTTIDTTNSPNSQDTGVTATIDVSTGVVEVEAANLLGAVEGIDPDIGDEVVVVGAHLDYAGVDPNNGDIFTGCDDNASGTAVMMELARAMAAHEPAPARTVLFAAWNGGDWSQSGSCHYVENPTLALADTVAAYSVDMVGSGDGTGVGVFGATLPENAWLAEVMLGSAAEMELTWDAQIGEPYELSDPIGFTENDVPGAMISTLGPHANVHTASDTIMYILPGDLEAAVWMTWAGLLPLAMGEEGSYTSKD